jgi:putative transposase
MIPRKKRKHCVRVDNRCSRTAANQEWALDFVHDVVECGRVIRVLSVVDAYSESAGSGHEFRQSESDASTGGDRGRARTAENNSLRQRAGDDEPAFSGVVRGTANRVGAHSTRQANAERAHQDFPRRVAGRVFDAELVSELVRARRKIAAWKIEYNQERPHASA